MTGNEPGVRTMRIALVPGMASSAYRWVYRSWSANRKSGAMPVAMRL